LAAARPTDLDEIIITAELQTRVPREPDYKAESEAFRELSESLGDGSAAVLDRIAATAALLCHADAGGVSLVTTDERGTPSLRVAAVDGALGIPPDLSAPYDLTPSGACLRLGAPQLYERPSRHFTGLAEYLPASVTEILVVPIHTAGGDVGTVWIAAQDAARRFDAEDVRLLESLARVAAVVTVQQQTLEDAAHEVTRRNELLSIGSHELRNPLTTVVGFANRLARRDDLPEDAREEVSLVAREASRLRRILDDFFDLAKLESASFALDIDEVDVIELLHEQVAAVRMRHPFVAVEVAFEAAPFIHSDPSRVAQIVTNLLENAAKYGGPSPHITVRLRCDDDLRIEVQDGGVGIPLEEHERIFDRAYRLTQRDGTPREGLGLGLYISRPVAQRLGGALTVQSEVGRGSTFTLTLPLTR
jgi:signal transduction histidine kinase